MHYSAQDSEFWKSLGNFSYVFITWKQFPVLFFDSDLYLDPLLVVISVAFLFLFSFSFLLLLLLPATVLHHFPSFLFSIIFFFFLLVLMWNFGKIKKKLLSILRFGILLFFFSPLLTFFFFFWKKWTSGDSAFCLLSRFFLFIF